MAKAAPNHVFRLRYPNSDQFSSGGSQVSAGNRGKIWNTPSGIESHIRRRKNRDFSRATYPEGMEIVTFELVEVAAITVEALAAERQAKVDAKAARRLEKEKKTMRLAAERSLAAEKEEFERLKAIYEPTT